MSDCEQAIFLSAYHDGELPPDVRTQFERHLHYCQSCRAELEQMRQVSRLMASAPRPAMPPAVMARLHQAVDRLPSRGVIRLAEALSAVAAVVLLACVIGLTQQAPAQASSDVPLWEIRAAVETPESTAEPEELLARLMTYDLSGNDDHEN